MRKEKYQPRAGSVKRLAHYVLRLGHTVIRVRADQAAIIALARLFLDSRAETAKP